jgi:hypothetical protein
VKSPRTLAQISDSFRNREAVVDTSFGGFGAPIQEEDAVSDEFSWDIEEFLDLV